MKPSPGEWRTEAVSDAVRVVVGYGRAKIILARLKPPQLTEAETHANAKLMAAAKELLDACRVVSAFLDGLETGTPEDDHLRAQRRRVHAPLRAALNRAMAKAEAES